MSTRDSEYVRAKRHLYRSLAQQFLLARVRVVQPRYRLLSVLLFLGGLAYAGLVLTSLAANFHRLVYQLAPGVPPLAYLNRELLGIFAGLFAFRFLSQRTSRIPLRSLLHLPVSRTELAHFFQVSSLATLHNVLPVFFAVPYWWLHRSTLHPAWLSGFLLMVALSHFATVYLRVVLSTTRFTTGMTLGTLGLVIAMDRVSGLSALPDLSSRLFARLGAGDAVIESGLLALVLLLYAGSTRKMIRSLRDSAQPYGRQTAPAWAPGFNTRYGAVLNLVLLESKLIWRHRRPRFYFLFSLVIGTLYVAALLGRNPVGHFRGSVAALFATGAFIFNYGQLMFSWESQFFDGLLARTPDVRQLVRAKITLLVGSCGLLYVVTLPIFYYLAPEHLALHLAFCLYNAGVSTLLILVLAVQNREKLDLSRGSNLFNYQGFTVAHWVWFVFTTLPPLLLVWVFRTSPVQATWAIAIAGLVCLALVPQWTGTFARRFAHVKYEMATGFRQNEN